MARTKTISDEQIIEAAREVFLEHGTAGTTAEIARRAGVSEGSIFRRFPTKDDLFTAAMMFPGEPPFVATLEALVGQGDLRENLVEKIRRLPDRPGIYVFEDGRGKALYVGKAKSLRKRAGSYLGGTQEPRIAAMLAEAADLEFLLTDSEAEALLLENNWIKRRKPRFNVLLRETVYPTTTPHGIEDALRSDKFFASIEGAEWYEQPWEKANQWYDGGFPVREPVNAMAVDAAILHEYGHTCVALPDLYGYPVRAASVLLKDASGNKYADTPLLPRVQDVMLPLPSGSMTRCICTWRGLVDCSCSDGRAGRCLETDCTMGCKVMASRPGVSNRQANTKPRSALAATSMPRTTVP